MFKIKATEKFINQKQIIESSKQIWTLILKIPRGLKVFFFIFYFNLLRSQTVTRYFR